MKKLNGWEIALLSLTLAFAAFLAGFFLGGRGNGQVAVHGEKVVVETQRDQMPASPQPEEKVESDPLPGTEEKINVNTATAEELESLPGIGPTLAQRIVEYRNMYGPFDHIDSLMDVSGIGEGKFGAIKDLIRVE